MLELNRAYCMDCMEGMKQFPDNYFDLAVVDPPYGIENSFKACSRIAKYGNMKTVNDAVPQKEYFEELFRVSKNQIVWGYNHLSNMLPTTKEFLFWYKHQPVDSYSDGELAWTSFKKLQNVLTILFLELLAQMQEKGSTQHKSLSLYTNGFSKIIPNRDIRF